MSATRSRRKPINGHAHPVGASNVAVAPAPRRRKLPAAAPAVSVDRTRRHHHRGDVLSGLTPELLLASLQQFAYGYLARAARLWDAMERRDDRLQALVPKAQSAISRYGYEILTVDGLTTAEAAEAAQHQAELAYFYGNLTAVNAVDENVSGGWSLFARQKADALAKRYSVHEILWQQTDAGLTAELRHAPLWFFENLSGRLRFLQTEGAGEGVDMAPEDWHVTAGPGLMEACGILYLFKHYPLKDWLGFCEKFGFPAVLGKTSAAADSPEWVAMENAVRNFGVDFGAVINQSDAIELIERKGGGDKNPFEGLVDRSERAMSILWRGADLSTASHSGGGKGTGASLQADETDKLDSDRAAWLGESLTGLSRQVIEYQFGVGVRPLAYLKVKTEVRRDVNLEIVVDTFLLTNGAPLAVDDVLERYGRQRPAKDAELLRPPAAAAPADPAQAVQQENALEKAANERTRAAAEQLQRSTTVAVLSAQAADLAPVRDRLAAVAGITDPTIQRAALEKLRADLPALLTQVNAAPAAGRALAAGLSAGLFNGLVTAAVETHAGPKAP